MLGFNTRKGYYTVQYDDNDEEELTSEEAALYLKPPEKGKYWVENLSGWQISKQIEKNSLKGMQVQYKHLIQLSTTSTNRAQKNKNILLTMFLFKKSYL